MTLDEALQSLTTDRGTAAPIVYEALLRIAAEVAQQFREDPIVMEEVTGKVLVELLQTPIVLKRKSSATGYIAQALRHELLDRREEEEGSKRVKFSRDAEPANIGSHDDRRGWRREWDLPVEELERSIEDLMTLAREHLKPEDVRALEALVRIRREGAAKDDEAKRLGVKTNTMEKQQERACTRLKAVLINLEDASSDPEEKQRLLRLTHLVDALRRSRKDNS